MALQDIGVITSKEERLSFGRIPFQIPCKSHMGLFCHPILNYCCGMSFVVCAREAKDVNVMLPIGATCG